MVGHVARRPVAHLVQRGIDARLRRVALGRERQVDGSLRQVDAALGIADDLGRLERGFSDEQRLRIGVADVLRRGNEHAARDELRVFSPIDHAGEPVPGCTIPAASSNVVSAARPSPPASSTMASRALASNR